ncbi:dienelactone hydrolase family protein [Aurantiacibacter poecillastricola]|uniref:dienelactone hydrolase family protein n=1 Tax=Aurantiacibacter poecillastricola TaxID=3064385 RepID=UPI00273E2349|nr:dienelactone hydrolase family protein [Aurantiacibacter sp. 219JJ12-13]MDP5260870.1 dienelactone hydrolase family protein [Aurantiacibacter sp. 219JJ12-13]
MCDQQQLANMGPVNRRQFGALAGAGAVAACAPMSGEADMTGGLVENTVTFAAPGGTFDGVFIHPASGSHPAVILWPDIAGLRPAKVQMGRRLAESGYTVLVANPYYRSVAGQQFEDFDDWRSNDGWNKVTPWREANTPEAIQETARAVVAWLDAQDAVDSMRGIGNQGYCMTGSWTIYAAAAVPSRVKAAASFHGGGLVGEGAMAPVNLLDDMADDAAALIAIARDDDAENPEAKTQLRAAAEDAAADIEVEVYDGDHGWTVLDSPVYAEAEAERAWSELLELYSQTL